VQEACMTFRTGPQRVRWWRCDQLVEVLWLVGDRWRASQW